MPPTNPIGPGSEVCLAFSRASKSDRPRSDLRAATKSSIFSSTILSRLFSCEILYSYGLRSHKEVTEIRFTQGVTGTQGVTVIRRGPATRLQMREFMTSSCTTRKPGTYRDA